MGRPVSTELLAFLAAYSVNTVTTLSIYPTVGDAINIATDTVTIDEVEYSPDLIRADQLQQSTGSGTNRVNVRIDNVYKTFGISLVNGDLVKAEAVLGRCYRNELDLDEMVWKELFRGQLLPIEVTESEAAIEIVSDLTSAGYVIAATNLAESCQWEFKGADCGYSGSETTCNKKRKSPGGCEGRDNEHRFGGMEFPEAQPSEPPSGPIYPPETGGGGPIRNCPRSDQYIIVRGDCEFTRVVKRADKLTLRDMVWHPIERRWQEIEALTRVEDQPIWELIAANGAAGYQSESHPILINELDRTGIAVCELTAGHPISTWSNGWAEQSEVVLVRDTGERAAVIRITLKGSHILAHGTRPDKMLNGHNAKPLPEIEF